MLFKKRESPLFPMHSDLKNDFIRIDLLQDASEKYYSHQRFGIFVMEPNHIFAHGDLLRQPHEGIAPYTPASYPAIIQNSRSFLMEGRTHRIVTYSRRFGNINRGPELNGDIFLNKPWLICWIFPGNRRVFPDSGESLVQRYFQTHQLQRRQHTVQGFRRLYTHEDIQFLAQTDAWHGTLSGQAKYLHYSTASEMFASSLTRPVPWSPPRRTPANPAQ